MKKALMTLVFFFFSIALSFTSDRSKSYKDKLYVAPVVVHKEIERNIIKSKLDESLFIKQVSRTGCFKTCKAILKELSNKLNVPIRVGGPKDKIQIVREFNNSLTQLSSDYSYIDKLLSKGIPALVGVHHTYNYGYNEGTTDHFVLIVSKNTADSTYRYFDVGKKSGTRTVNSFKLINNKLSNEKNKKSFVVSQIRILRDHNGIDLVSSELVSPGFYKSKETYKNYNYAKCRLS